MREYTLFAEFQGSGYSVMRDVSYYVLVEYGVPMKIVRINKTCLNDASDEVRAGK
jgi:hypothetical protein